MTYFNFLAKLILVVVLFAGASNKLFSQDCNGMLPVPVCNDITISLEAEDCGYTLTQANLDAISLGSTSMPNPIDPGCIATTVISFNGMNDLAITFNDTQLGANNVTVTVTNSDGEVQVCNATVNVELTCPTALNELSILADGIVPTEDLVFCSDVTTPVVLQGDINVGGNTICATSLGAFDNLTLGVVDNGDGTGTFTPSTAGVGDHSIVYIFVCPASGQEFTALLNVEVVDPPTANLVDGEVVTSCLAATGTYPLAGLFEDDSSTDGTWTVDDAMGGTVNTDGSFDYVQGGCYEFTFTADDPYNCADPDPSDVAIVNIVTKPEITFSMQLDGSNFSGGCISENITLMPNIVTDAVSTTGTVSINNAAPTPWTPGAYPITSPASFASSTYEFTVVATNAIVDCNGIPTGDVCTRESSYSVAVFNDGAMCASECEFMEFDVCEANTNPTLEFSCSFFTIDAGANFIEACFTPTNTTLSCTDEDFMINYELKTGSATSGGGGGTIGDLPGLGAICDILSFKIGVGPFSIRPLGFLADILMCDEKFSDIILDLIAVISDGNGGITVVADTDSDGSFDHIVQENDGTISGTATIPNNVNGRGQITVRAVAGFPDSPAGVCGEVHSSGLQLLDLLPIGSIPIVGPLIEYTLILGGCGADLAFSNEQTTTFQVFNDSPPVFINCNTEGYTITEDFGCDTEANWSVPVAIDNCTGEILQLDAATVATVEKTAGPDIGDDLAVGTYSVTYTATACNGLTAACTFPIVVTAGDPVLVAPNNITVCTDIDECTAVVNGLAPLQGIGCHTDISYTTTGVTSITDSNPADTNIHDDISGSTFNLGITTVTYTMAWDHDGDATTADLTRTAMFTVTVEDCQAPVAECLEYTIQLNNVGEGTVTAENVDGLSTDNCTDDLTLEISKNGTVFSDDVSFDCTELGTNFVTLRVTDEAGNISNCLATVEVIDFFEDYELTFDVPELCFEANNPEQYDFTNYLQIRLPDGTIIDHSDIGTLGTEVMGIFGISSYVPSTIDGGAPDDSSNTPTVAEVGTIDATTGVYTPGTLGSGFITVTYVLSIDGQLFDSTLGITGCHQLVHETLELRQPLMMSSPECECINVEFRQVDLGVVSGGVEPYRIQYTGGFLDTSTLANSDGLADDSDGSYTYDVANGYNITDGEEDLGILLLNYTDPTWFITVVDARGCEIARSGSCDNPDDMTSPIIECVGTDDFDTEVIICESQYSWVHDIPFDQCAVSQYSYTITNPDGTIEGPFDLSSIIDSAEDDLPFEGFLDASYDFEIGTSIVSYYAEDAVGNPAECSFVVTVEDNDTPVFLNCPEPVVNVSTEFGQCDQFANFALPIADDNCGALVVTQIDNTGLSAGDRFPIGTTILTFEASDAIGNTALCTVKVTVNNFDNVPEITCPDNVEAFNDDWQCSAVINNISPVVSELCDDFLITPYQIVHEGAVIESGFDDASGYDFPVGLSTVTYRVQNQPVLLITEIAQDADNLLGGMNPPPVTNQFQCISNPVEELGNGGDGEVIVNYPVDNILYHFSGGVDGDEFMEEIFLNPNIVQPNHVPTDTYGSEGDDPAGEITGIVYDPALGDFVAMDISGNIYEVSSTGQFILLGMFNPTALPGLPVSLRGFAIVGTSYYGVDPASSLLFEFDATGAILSTQILSGAMITGGLGIANDPVTGDVTIIYSNGGATSMIGTVDLTTGVITEVGDTGMDLVSIAYDNDGQLYGVSSDTASIASTLFTVDCVEPGNDYIEVTNFGPQTYDISCLLITRKLADGSTEEVIIPEGVVLAPGEVIVVHFGAGIDDLVSANKLYNFFSGVDQDPTEPVAYCVSYGDNIFDAMTMFADATAGIIRTSVFDTDTPADFVIAEDCNPLTLLDYSMDLYPPAIDNGLATSLQDQPMSTAECSFTVTVSDAEAPMCMEAIPTTTTYAGPAMLAVEGECNESVISIPSDCILTEINVGLQGDIVGAENITVTLTSPDGEALELYSGACEGDIAGVNMVFDDEAEDDISSFCGAGTGSFMPQDDMLMTFYTSKSAGDWTLNIHVDDGFGSSFNLTAWSIEATCMTAWEPGEAPSVFANWDTTEDAVVIENIQGLCEQEYTWIHPYFVDNCEFGTIAVEYIYDDGQGTAPTGGLLTDNFGKGGFEVTETFPVGTTTVKYTLTDIAAGTPNTQTCEFDIIVEDVDIPILIECPDDIQVQLVGGECRDVVTYVVTAEDNCGIESIIGVPPSGSIFEIGETEVIVTVTDINGLTIDCVFPVIVDEYLPTTAALSCNDHINLSLSSDCEAVVTPDMILEGGEFECYEDYCIVITDSDDEIHPNLFGFDDQGQTFTVTINDCNTGTSIGNSCWGTVTIEEKFVPILNCPADIVIYCNDDANERLEDGTLATGEVEIVNCELDPLISFGDVYTDFGICSNDQDVRAQIVRTWTVEDIEGNVVSCDQIISFRSFKLEDVDFPDHLTYADGTALTCTDVNASPLDGDGNPLLTSPQGAGDTAGTGFPTINGDLLPLNGGLCSFSLNIEDEIYDICDSSYEILRTWKVRNKCEDLVAGVNPLEYIQIIEVIDTEGPIMDGIPDHVDISANPWQCRGAADLPVPTFVSDGCGAISAFDAQIIGGGVITVTGSVEGGDLGVNVAGLARFRDYTVIYSAKDACANKTSISFTVNAIDNVPPTVITLENIVVGLTDTGQEGTAKLFAEHVDNGSHDGDCGGIFLQIRRDDSNLCGNPGNDTFVSNSDDSSLNTDIDEGQFVKFCCEDLEGGDTYLDAYGNTITYKENIPVILRVWDDADRDGIAGTDGDNYNESWAYVRLENKIPPVIIPPANTTLDCDDPQSWALHLDGQVSASEEELKWLEHGSGIATAYNTCNELGVTYSDEYEDDVCYPIEIVRTWCIDGTSFCQDQKINIINVGSFDPTSISWIDGTLPEKIDVECLADYTPEEPTWDEGPCDFVSWTVSTDTFYIEGNAQAGFGCIKLQNNYSVVDWCDNNTSYDFIQTVQIFDDSAPTIDVEALSEIRIDGITCDSPVTLCAIAIDQGDCISPWLKWDVSIDIFDDGSFEYDYSNYATGDDNVISIDPTASGEDLCIALPEDLASSKYQHRVIWKVSDGCGNSTVESSYFTVIDRKAPTPYCYDVSTALMINGSVEIWACDFVLEGSDNCTVLEDLRYTFTDVPPSEDLEYDSVSKCSAKTFVCADINNENSGVITLPVYTWDECDNYSICYVELTLSGNCNADAITNSVIAGRVSTEYGSNMADVSIRIESNQPEYPLEIMTNQQGEYSSVNVNGYGYQSTAISNNDPRNGVTTLDILLIQRHLLNIQPFEAPHQHIAADVNRDGRITAADMVDIRKLILEINHEFSSSNSWQFAMNDEELDNDNALDYKDTHVVNYLDADILNQDWVAIKIGDVNGSVTVNSRSERAEGRSGEKLEVLFEQSETNLNVIHVKSNSDISIHGLQLALSAYNNVLLDVLPGIVDIHPANINLNTVGDKSGLSWNSLDAIAIKSDDILFSLVLENHADASSITILNNDSISAQAYDLDLNILSISQFSEEVADYDFTLLQNEPNPFFNQTIVRFSLPESMEVTMKIFDNTGRLVTDLTDVFSMGLNSIVVDQNTLGSSGVYQYQISTAHNTLSKKMILIKE